MNNEQLTEKVMELEKDSAAQHEQLKSVFSRLDKQDAIIESLRALTSTIGTLADSQARIEKKINNITTDVDELKAKPGKRWEAVVGYVLAAVVSGVIGFMLRGL
jgi:chromosome segregation ATPase